MIQLTGMGLGLAFDLDTPAIPTFEHVFDLPVGSDSTDVAAYVQRDYSRAYPLYAESLRLARLENADDEIANALNNLGVLHYMWGSLDRALEHYQQALAAILTNAQLAAATIPTDGDDGEVLANLFRPFFTTRDDGLGMGLAISKRLVEAHDGRISARRAGAQGLVVSFELPST